MEVTKETIAKKMYREMDISFDISELVFEDEFVQAFKDLMRDYTLIPTSNIIIN